VAFSAAHEWMYRLHTRWCRLPVERFDAIHYVAMTLYKVRILLLNLVPYVAVPLARAHNAA
jgi:hypothetical protein